VTVRRYEWLVGGHPKGAEVEPVGANAPSDEPSTNSWTVWAFSLDQVSCTWPAAKQVGFDGETLSARIWGAGVVVEVVELVLVVELLVVVELLLVVVLAVGPLPPPPTTSPRSAPRTRPAAVAPASSGPGRRSNPSPPPRGGGPEGPPGPAPAEVAATVCSP